MEVIFTFLVLGPFILVLLYLLLRRPSRDKRVFVVVLGDIGRSPRMQYHCLSLSREGFHVDFIGYSGSVPHRDITMDGHITIHHLTELPSVISKLPRLAVYAAKVVWQSSTLLLTLLMLDTPSHILLQNPPALPCLALCWLVSRLRGSTLVVDWHNYGYTILSLALGPHHLLVRLAKWYEHFFGRLSDRNICVTKAMKEDLKTSWRIEAVTMYDRAPSMFKETSLQQQHTLFTKLSKQYHVFRSSEGATAARTAFTVQDADGSVTQLPRRPALLISSTSWTEDEDFSILLNALQKYEDDFDKDDSLPELVCAITGKGPQKAHYMSLIERKSWHHVIICTPWLEAEDYPKLLGSADLGLCLHLSSSGLDLPMKVVDMFGCGLPVCAIHFQCLDELVKSGENGLVFSTELELAQQMKDLLRGFPDSCSKLTTFRQNLQAFQNTRWTDAWTDVVKPIFVL